MANVTPKTKIPNVNEKKVLISHIPLTYSSQNLIKYIQRSVVRGPATPSISLFQPSCEQRLRLIGYYGSCGTHKILRST